MVGNFNRGVQRWEMGWNGKPVLSKHFKGCEMLKDACLLDANNLLISQWSRGTIKLDLHTMTKVEFPFPFP